MERLTERKKNGVPVMRLDLPKGEEGNLVARLAAYEDTGLPPETVAVATWPGRTVWILSRPYSEVAEGIVTLVHFDGHIYPRIEVMVGGCHIYGGLLPEDIFLTRDEAETAAAEAAERRAAQG